MDLKIGKRYRCDQCQGQVLVVKPSATATLECCGLPMDVDEPKQVPSSD